MELFVLAILLSVTGALESQLEGPQNTASVVGSTVTLKCSSPSRNCNGIDWQKFVRGYSSITVFKGPRTILDGVDKDRYSVDNSSGCDLVIRNVQLTDAGRFICSAIISSSQATKTAHLIILEAQPNCTMTTFWNETAVGDEVQLNCAMAYNEANRTSMVWQGAKDAPKSVEKAKSRSDLVVASAPEVPSYTCITSITVETKDNGKPIAGMATNIPNATCETPVVKVISTERFRVEGPQNTLGVVGSTATLKCSSSTTNCGRIEWVKYDSAGSRTAVFNDRQGISLTYGDRYSFNDTSSGCELIIRNIQLIDAGLFGCLSAISGRIIEKVAYLIVLETQLKCTTLTYWHALSVGDEVKLNCLVTYNEANTASMFWEGVEGTPVNVKKGKTISRSDWIVASAPEVPSFTCITSFPVETRDKNGAPLRGLARNIPNTTCTTSRIKVFSAQQLRVEEPQNTLSFVGSTVTLKCSSPLRICGRIEWLKYSAGSSVPVFNDRTGISSAYAHRYSVDSSSCFELTIQNVQLIDAGRFICSTFISTMIIEKTAYLIVFDNLPKCSVYASLDNTTEGDAVQVNCVMTMNGINTTAMVWNRVDDATGAVVNEQSLIWSYYVAAFAPEVPSFTCIIYPWAVETKDVDGRKIKGLAANMLNTTCATTAVKVLYSVRDVKLAPSFSTYPPGSRIVCKAKGHPAPTFKWQEIENDSTWMDIQNQNDCEFTATNVSSKWYRCVAMNVVRGQSHSSNSHEFQFNNTESDENDSLTVTTTSSPPSTVVASVAAGVLFICLLFILPINCFLVRTCPGYNWWHSRKMSKDKIREEYPLSENPDLYSSADQLADAHATVKPRLVAPTDEPPSRPQLALPPRTTNPKTELSSP